MARTPLHYETWSAEVTRELIAEGHDVNETDSDGMTPLHFACKDKHYDAAKVLLEAGAQVDPQDKWGNTPLRRAVAGNDGTTALVQLLIEHGANPAVENQEGVSPLSFAKQLQKTDYLAIFDKAGYS